MASGLIALLDDVAAIAKIAAASLDDAAAQALKAGSKAAGIVIDDTAVTPRYVTGFSADRELPIIAKIAKGSLRNKLFFLLPAALALSAFAPWAIPPLLMAGGAFLCFEGYEKVHELVTGHADEDDPNAMEGVDPKSLEDEKVSGAIRTDMILSAEIMALSLAQVATAPFVEQVLALVVVAFGITGLVYGAVALIVKADDVGLVLARSQNFALRGVGRGLVSGMPSVLRLLGLVGTAAMLWVGGGIVLHEAEYFGFGALQHAIHGFAQAIAAAIPFASGFAGWLVEAFLAGVFGLGLGYLVLLGVTLVKRFRR